MRRGPYGLVLGKEDKDREQEEGGPVLPNTARPTPTSPGAGTEVGQTQGQMPAIPPRSYLKRSKHSNYPGYRLLR